MVNERAVRILLECILVFIMVSCANKCTCSDESFGLCCHIFVAYRGENFTTSQNIEVADAKGSHPSKTFPVADLQRHYRKLPPLLRIAPPLVNPGSATAFRS